MTFAEKLWKEWFKNSVVVGSDPYFIKKDEFISELSQAIEKDILEFIGEDEPAEFGKSHRPSDVVGLDHAIQRNKLKTKLRLKIKEYCSGKA
jgi:hypothetical protein